ASEDFSAAEPHTRARALDEALEADDRRDPNLTTGGAVHQSVYFEYLGLPQVYQDDCPPRMADIEWLIVLVQNEDRVHLRPIALCCTDFIMVHSRGRGSTFRAIPLSRHDLQR